MAKKTRRPAQRPPAKPRPIAKPTLSKKATPSKKPTQSKTSKKSKKPQKPAKSGKPAEPEKSAKKVRGRARPAKRPRPIKPTARPGRPARPLQRAAKSSGLTGRPPKPTPAAPEAQPAPPPAAPPPQQPAATADAPAKKKYTSEENRGRHFFSAIRMWRILHEDRGQTIFNKEELAKKFYEGIEDEENPEPEVVDELINDDPTVDPDDRGLGDDDFGDEDLGDDDLKVDALDGSDDPADGPASWGLTMLESDAAPATQAPQPYAWIKEKHKRAVQRIIEKLKKYGIGIDDVNEKGGALTEDQLAERQKADRWAERWWRYNPNGEWAKDFSTLLKSYGINAGQLIALMAVRDLLKDMWGVPHHQALQEMLDELKRSVPPKLLDDAEEQSRAYRHSVGNTAKYIKKSAHLSRWYAAVLDREQVKIEYTTPGSTTRVRHVAALGTVFHREENAIYLLASEWTEKEGWIPVRQWKFDRVTSVHKTGLPNPSLAELPHDPLVKAAPGRYAIERLDNERIYYYSGGAWLEVGTEPKRLEVVVRVPDVRREGLSKKEIDELKREDRRRAYGWMMWCREKPFHPRQDATMEPGKNGEEQLRIVVERCYVKDMASRLLRLQDCFEVIEPPELVALLKQYGAAVSTVHDETAPGRVAPPSRPSASPPPLTAP